MFVGDFHRARAAAGPADIWPPDAGDGFSEIVTEACRVNGRAG